MSIINQLKNKDEILNHFSRNDSYRKAQGKFPEELKIRTPRTAFRFEICIGIVNIVASWFLLFKHFEITTFFGIGIMVLIGSVMINGAIKKKEKNKYDLNKVGILAYDQLIKWNEIIEVQHVRIKTEGRTFYEILRVVTNGKPLDLPLTNIDAKPKVVIDLVNYKLNE